MATKVFKDSFMDNAHIFYMSCFREFHINSQLFVGMVEVLKHGITNSGILSCNSYFQVNIGKHSEDVMVWGFI